MLNDLLNTPIPIHFFPPSFDLGTEHSISASVFEDRCPYIGTPHMRYVDILLKVLKEGVEKLNVN